MRILMVHNAYAKPSGEEFAVEAISRLLVDHGHQVVSYQKSSANLPPTLAGNTGAFFSGIYSPFARAEIVRLLNSTQIDLVQIQNLYPQISCSVLRPFFDRRIPVVMRCPNYRLFCPTGLHLRANQICERCLGGREWNCALHNCAQSRMKSVGYALRNAFARISGMIRNYVSIFVVLSEFQKNKCIKNGIPAERIAVVPNFEAAPPVMLQQSSEPGQTIAFVGRPSPEKGIATFLAAARALPDFQFAVAGDTSEMGELLRQSPANVRYSGFLSGSDLDEFYHRARIFIYSGIWFEGFPNAVTRAMAAGKPVISSRIGAMPEIVSENQTGILFEPGSVEQLASHIRTLYPDVNRCRALGEAGRAKVGRDYTPEAAYAALMEAYARAQKIVATSNSNT